MYLPRIFRPSDNPDSRYSENQKKIGGLNRIKVLSYLASRDTHCRVRTSNYDRRSNLSYRFFLGTIWRVIFEQRQHFLSCFRHCFGFQLSKKKSRRIKKKLVKELERTDEKKTSKFLFTVKTNRILFDLNFKRIHSYFFGAVEKNL